MTRHLGWVLVLVAVPARGQQEPKRPANLAAEQEAVTRRYTEFENVLNRMADLMRKSDPDRAALISKVFSQSKKDLVGHQLEELVAKLKKGELSTALKEQQAVREDMIALLDLLLSEDKAKQLKERRERIEQYLKDVAKLRRRQQEVRGETERAANDEQGRKLAERQGELSRDTKQLAERIKQDDAKANQAGKEKQGEAGKPNATPGQPRSGNEGQQGEEGKQGSQGQQGGKEAGGEKSQGSQGSQSQSGGKSSQGKSQSGGSQSGGQQGDKSSDQKQSGDAEQDNQRTPGQQNIEAAQKAMEDAKRRLEELKRQEASEEQDKAIKELEKAIQELEEILRQLREEERQQLLASLEARFKKMLEMQRIVYDGTTRLDQIPAEKRTRADEQKAAGLSRREAAIATEAEQALLILREDGTAIAFPAALEQVRDDVMLATSLLAKVEVGKFTQGVETDIIAALEEMIAALQKEMREAKSKNQPPQQGQQGPMPLVDQLAELKMIRSLQQRVNQRTDRVAALQQEGVPPTDEIKTAITDLAERQIKIYQITHDIVVGKNK